MTAAQAERIAAVVWAQIMALRWVAVEPGRSGDLLSVIEDVLLGEDL